MIFGEDPQKRQGRLEHLFTHRVRKYAILPKRLEDGRIAWLQWLWVKVPVRYWGGDMFTIEQYGKYRYYLTET